MPEDDGFEVRHRRTPCHPGGDPPRHRGSEIGPDIRSRAGSPVLGWWGRRVAGTPSTSSEGGRGSWIRKGCLRLAHRRRPSAAARAALIVIGARPRDRPDPARGPGARGLPTKVPRTHGDRHQHEATTPRPRPRPGRGGPGAAGVDRQHHDPRRRGSGPARRCESANWTSPSGTSTARSRPWSRTCTARAEVHQHRVDLPPSGAGASPLGVATGSAGSKGSAHSAPASSRSVVRRSGSCSSRHTGGADAVEVVDAVPAGEHRAGLG